MISIEYDITISEVETATKRFWVKYNLKRAVLFSIVYAISVFLSVFTIVNGGGVAFWILLGFSAGLLLNQWTAPGRRRKKLIAALETMYEEKYAAVFSDKEIEIETVIHAEDEEKTEKSRYILAEDELYSIETDGLFLLFVNRWATYVFPKRCLSEQQTEEVRNYFKEKKI